METTLDKIQTLLASARTEADRLAAETSERKHAEERAAGLAAWEARCAAGPVTPQQQIDALAWLSGEYLLQSDRPFATPEEIAAWLALAPGSDRAWGDRSRPDGLLTARAFASADPRTAAEYTRRAERITREDDEHRARNIAEDEAKRAAREARETQHKLDLARVVALLGDADAQSAWAEGVLSHAHPVELLAAALRAPTGISGTGDLHSRDEKITDVERVGVEAYRRLRTLREEIAALGTACPVIDARHPATVEYDLERVTWGEEGYGDGTQSAYCVLVRYTIGTIEVASRYPLT